MEEELIKECQKNNREAQSKLFYLYKDRLFALCLKYCKNVDDAEDNLHDSFLAIFKNIKKYKSKGSFEGWIKRITINTAIQKYRDNSTLQLIKDENIVEEEIALEEDLGINVLLELIQELPDRYRLVFNLYVLDNFSHKEIASMLKISEGTSKSNLSRAKLILKEKINNYKSVEIEA